MSITKLMWEPANHDTPGWELSVEVRSKTLRDVTLYFSGRFKMYFMIPRLGAK